MDEKSGDGGRPHQRIGCPLIYMLFKKRDTEGGNGSTDKENSNSCDFCSFYIHEY